MALDAMDPSDCDFDALWSQFQDGEEEDEGNVNAFSSELSEPSKYSPSFSAMDEPQKGKAASVSSSSRQFLLESPEDNDAHPLKPPQATPSVSVAESFPGKWEEEEVRARDVPSHPPPPREMHHHHSATPHHHHHHPFFPPFHNPSDMAQLAHHPNAIYLPHLNGYAIPIQHLPREMLVSHWPGFGGIAPSHHMPIQHGFGHASPVMAGQAPSPDMASPPLLHAAFEPHHINHQQQQPRRRGRQLKRKAPQPKPDPEEAVALPDGFDRVLLKAATQDEPDFSPDGEWKPPVRKYGRRCETKIMLQTPDGLVFNRYFEEEDIRDFVFRFKTFRIEYGFSQAEVGATLGRRYGSEFSQTTVSRFESMVLSHSNMCKLRPPFEQWLADIQAALESGVPVEQLRRASKNGEFWPAFEAQTEDPQSVALVAPLRKRRKRTCLEAAQSLALESYFQVNDRPDNLQMHEISQTLDLDFDVIRVWFCNRRQKIQKELLKAAIKTEIVEASPEPDALAAAADDAEAPTSSID